jgi:adhesin transport system membrane fusion protein
MNVHVVENRKVLWISIGTVAVFILWSAFASIDQVTRATGQVISSSRSQIIQSADGGVLEKLFVKEGDSVTKNQILALLDQTRSEAAYMETRAKVVALMAQTARLRAEVYGGAVKFPPEVNDYPIFKHEQMTLLKRRQEAIQAELSGMREAAALAKKELALNEPLLKTGDIGEVDVIRLKRQVVDIETQMAAKSNKYFQDAQAELTKAEED